MKPNDKTAVRWLALLMIIFFAALIVSGCGKKGPPVPKYPFQAEMQDERTHTIL